LYPNYFCGRQLALKYEIRGGDGDGFGNVNHRICVYKHAEAPAAQFAGAGDFAGNVRFDVSSVLHQFISVDVYFSNAYLASCRAGEIPWYRPIEEAIDVEGITNTLAQKTGEQTRHMTLFQLGDGRLVGYVTRNQNFDPLATQLRNNQLANLAIFVEIICGTNSNCSPWSFTITGFSNLRTTINTIRTLVKPPWSKLFQHYGWLGSLETSSGQTGGGVEYTPPSKYIHYSLTTGTVKVMSPVAFGALFANALLPVDVPPKSFTINTTLTPTAAVFWS